MTLNDLKTLARAYVPGAKTSVINDTVLELILNNGAKEVAAITICLKANTQFNAVADQREYSLSSVVGDFLVMDDPGLWWNEGGTHWKQLIPKTMKWLDENRANWRDEDSGNPMYYYQEGDTIGVHPKPDTTLASGFHIYYGRKPTPMTDATHYAFEGSTEIDQLSLFDEAILYYWKWKVGPALNKDNSDDFRKNENAFYNEVARKLALFRRRPDMSASRYNQMQGMKIRA